jgi:CheY-like chemotaxis protein
MPTLKTVLLVDDDNMLNQLHKLILLEQNFAEMIIAKSNGQEALDFLKDLCLSAESADYSACPDMVLLDINMPLMNGWEMLSALKELGLGQFIRERVVMLSSSRHMRDLETAKSFGVKGFLVKPLNELRITELEELSANEPGKARSY